jgi:hypothetical protein
LLGHSKIWASLSFPIPFHLSSHFLTSVKHPAVKIRDVKVRGFVVYFLLLILVFTM